MMNTEKELKEQINKQHTEFIAKIEKISTQLDKGVDLGTIRESIDLLTKYGKVHFAYEEKLKLTEKHKQVHKKFNKELQEFLTEFKQVYETKNMSAQKLKIILQKIINKLKSNYLKHLLK